MATTLIFYDLYVNHRLLLACIESDYPSFGFLVEQLSYMFLVKQCYSLIRLKSINNQLSSGNVKCNSLPNTHTRRYAVGSKSIADRLCRRNAEAYTNIAVYALRWVLLARSQ